MKRFYPYMLFTVIFRSWLNLAAAQNIEFPDENLANKVRAALGLPAGAAIPKAELATLTVLDALTPEDAAPAEQISDLTGLEHATQLIELYLSSNAIVDISPLADLTNLMDLYLKGNPIKDASPLQPLLNQLTDLILTIDTDSIWSVSFSPDGTRLATGAANGIVQLLDVATREIIDTLDAHTDDVKSVSFSPDGTLLASGSLDGTVKLWDVAKRETIATLPAGAVSSVSFSPDGTRLASGAADGITLWNVATQEIVDTLSTENVNAVSFSPDGTLLASGEGETLEGRVKLWDVATRTNITTFGGDYFDVHSVSFSPDGRLLAINASVWDVKTKEHVATFVGDGGGLTPVSFSPDGTLLAIGDGSFLLSTVKLWDITTRETIATLEGHRDDVLTVAFSPDGTLLASGAEDGRGVRLWDVASYITQLEREKLAGDVNSDGVVNIQDLVLVAAKLGETGQTDADVNGDGVVDIRDLVKVAGALGNAAAAPSLHPQALAMFTAADVRQWLSEAESLNLTDITSQKGILFLTQLLAALIPKETALLPNYPNPFNPETWLPYQLAQPADVTLTIYTANGAVVRTLTLGHQPAGMYQNRSRAAYWDGRNAVGEPVASGVYFYTLTAGEFTATRKMLIRK